MLPKNSGLVFYSTSTQTLKPHIIFTLEELSTQACIDTLGAFNKEAYTMLTVVNAVTALVATKQLQGITVAKAGNRQLYLTLPETHQWRGEGSGFVNIKPHSTLGARVDGLLAEMAPKLVTSPCSSSVVLASLPDRHVKSSISSGSRSRSRRSGGENRGASTIHKQTLTAASKKETRKVDEGKEKIMRTIQADAKDRKWHGKRSWWGQIFGSTPNNKEDNDCPTTIVTIVGMLMSCDLSNPESVESHFRSLHSLVKAAAADKQWFRGDATQSSYDDYQRLIDGTLDTKKFKV